MWEDFPGSRDATAYWSAEQTKCRKDNAAKIFCCSHGILAGIVPHLKGIFPYSVRSQNPRTTPIKGTLKELKRERAWKKRERRKDPTIVELQARVLLHLGKDNKLTSTATSFRDFLLTLSLYFHFMGCERDGSFVDHRDRAPAQPSSSRSAQPCEPVITDTIGLVHTPAPIDPAISLDPSVLRGHPILINLPPDPDFGLTTPAWGASTSSYEPKSSKQDTVADSTTKAEYIAASEAAKEAVWIKKFIIELGVIPSISDAVDLYCDNNGAIAQGKEPRYHQRSKHFLRRFHLIHEIIVRGDVEICKVHTDDNIVDPLTKPLAQQKHDRHAESLDIRYVSYWS
ncbi:hypothetical protein GQ457_04G020370 [Hibiscus cannabinus]